MTSRDKVKVFSHDIKSPARTEVMNAADSVCCDDVRASALTYEPQLGVLIQVCSNVSHHTQDVAARHHSHVLRANVRRFYTDHVWSN